MSTICVIGGTGFIGSHLLKLLRSDGRYRVKTLSRKLADQFVHLTNEEVIVGDMMNADSLLRFLEPGSVVVNLAYMPDRPPEDNFKATRNLAKMCTKVGVARLIHVSTAVVVCRAAPDVITEQTVCEPVTEYEKTRLEVERVLLERLSGHCEVAILRPTEVFGENGRGLIRLATDLIEGPGFLSCLKPSLYSRRRLHLVYVENVVAAIRYLLSTGQDIHSQCYILSDDEAPENNYADVVRLIAGFLGVSRTPKVYFECPPSVLSVMLWMAGRSDTNPRRVYRCDKLLLAGFRKPVPFVDGVRRFAEWFKSGERAAASI